MLKLSVMLFLLMFSALNPSLLLLPWLPPIFNVLLMRIAFVNRSLTGVQETSFVLCYPSNSAHTQHSPTWVSWVAFQPNDSSKNNQNKTRKKSNISIIY